MERGGFNRGEGSSGRGGTSPRGGASGRGRGGGTISRGHGFRGGSGRAVIGPDQMPPTYEPNYFDLFQKNLPGTSGQLLPVIANYFFLNFEPEMQCDLNKYRVEIDFFSKLKGEPEPLPEQEQECSTSSESVERPMDPMVPPVLKRNYDRILKQFLETDPRFAQDWVAHAMPLVFTKFEVDLKRPPSKVTVEIDGRPRDFFVKVSSVKNADLKPLNLYHYYSENTEKFPEAFAVVNRAVMKTAMERTFFKSYNRFYDLTDQTCGKKVDFTQGVTATVRNSELGPLLNMHLKTGISLCKKFKTLDSAYMEFVNIPEGKMPSNDLLQQFGKFIKNLCVYTTHVPGGHERIYRCGGMYAKMPEQIFINVKKNNVEVKCNLKEYFLEKYKILLKKLPVVQIKHRYVEFLPLELCLIQENQMLNTKALIYPDIQQELLHKSTHTPNAYFNKLTRFSNQLTQRQNVFTSEFGLTLNPKPLSFDARVLDPVKRLNDTRSSKFFRPEKLVWALFSIDPRVTLDQLKNFGKKLSSKAKEKGLNVQEPIDTVVESIEINGVANFFSGVYEKLVKKHGVKLVVVVLSRSSDPRYKLLYEYVKKESETHYGFVTQCASSNVILRGMPAGYFDNILMKVNTKLGGQNSSYQNNAFDFLNNIDIGKTLIIGIDIAASVGFIDLKDNRRFVGVVSQYGPALGKFYSSCESRRMVQNVIVDIGILIRKHFDNYYQQCRVYPDHLLIYRAGMPRMDSAFENECKQIEIVVNSLGKPITITLILMNKMSDTRFAMLEPQEPLSFDKKGTPPSSPKKGTSPSSKAKEPRKTFNVPSGTVIDRYIVDPDRRMFYLNSQFSPLGTSKPTAYWITRDNSNMTMDEIQQLTLALCANSPRTLIMLSMPVVVRNAHLCAQRAGFYSDASPTTPEGVPVDNPVPHQSVVHKVFYC